MCAEKKLDAPVTKSVTEFLPNKGVLGKVFKKDAKIITDHLAGLDAKAVDDLEAKLNGGENQTLNIDGKDFTLTKDMMSGVKRYDKKVC